jgi:dihydrofolate reductase
MRKILAFLVVTVDGYYEGPNGEFDWPVVDEEFNEFGLQQLEQVDTLLFGRVTYEGMASYWPTPAAEQDDPGVAAKMNTLPKLVVSRTLDKADWANTRILGDDVAAELTRLKQQPGKDIAIFGSSEPVVSLLGWGWSTSCGSWSTRWCSAPASRCSGPRPSGCISTWWRRGRSGPAACCSPTGPPGRRSWPPLRPSRRRCRSAPCRRSGSRW